MSDAMVSTVGVMKLGAVEVGESGIGFTVNIEGGPSYEGGAYIGETNLAVAEYNALIWGLENAVAAEVDFAEVSLRNGELIAQLQGLIHVDPGLKPLYWQVLMLLKKLKGYAFVATYEGNDVRPAELAEQAINTHETVGDYLSRPTLKQKDLKQEPAETEKAPAEETEAVAPERYLSTDTWTPAFPDDEDPFDSKKSDDKTKRGEGASVAGEFNFSGYRVPPAPEPELEPEPELDVEPEVGPEQEPEPAPTPALEPEPVIELELTLDEEAEVDEVNDADDAEAAELVYEPIVEEEIALVESEFLDEEASQDIAEDEHLAEDTKPAFPAAISAMIEYASSPEARATLKSARNADEEEVKAVGNESAPGSQVAIPFEAVEEPAPSPAAVSKVSASSASAPANPAPTAPVASSASVQASESAYIPPVKKPVRTLDDTASIDESQKTVVVGVTGCIAAYKACEVVRGLQNAGYRVKVMMTENATKFVGPATFHALTSEPVSTSLFGGDDPVPHITLAKEADLMLIVPCTANVMAKIAHGMADDLLTTAVLAARGPVLIAPAMNSVMWNAAATQENLETIVRHGIGVCRPVEGHLACGDEGAGKLADVDDIVADARFVLEGDDDLAGLKVLVTAGPTQEPIDPVRFIGNRSSGKTGYAIAAAAARRGAKVTLVSGPTALPDPRGVETIHVNTASEMFSACSQRFHGNDLAIFSAAVADYAPANPSETKVKKDEGGLSSVELRENPDILKTLAISKGDTYVIGFAAETDDVLEHARGKLSSKNANMIVANDVSGELGFESADNKVWFVTRSGVTELPVMSKEAIADELLDAFLEDYTAGE